MTQYDLAGNPLPGGGAPPQYDLAGNPVTPQSAPMAGRGAYAPPGMGAPAVQYDLAGNPLPGQQSAPSYGGGAPQYGAPGQQGGPYGGSGQQGGPYGETGPQGAPGRGAAAANPGNTKAIGVGVGVLIAAVVLGGIVVKLLVPGRVDAPTSYQNFVAPNKDFQVAGPSGWDVVTAYGVAGDSSSDSNVGGVKFKSGPAFIDVTTDSVASIRADILLNGAGAAPDALFGSQAGYEQRRSKARVASILRNYDETKMPPFESALGEAAIAEYTADGPKYGIGPKVHGYRATLVGGTVFALVNCQCPEADWETLKPAFVKVINTVADGHGPPPPVQ